MAIRSDGYDVPIFLKQAYGQLLIDGVVLGQKNIKFAPVFAQGVTRDHGRTAPRGWRFSQGRQHGLEQFALPEGLDEIDGDPQFTTSGGVAPLPGRGQHHDRGAGELRVVLDALGQ